MKRDIQALVAAHIMDPERRALFVEGQRDRHFFAAITAESQDQNTVVYEIAVVEMKAPTEGGNRAKLLEFAKLICDRNLNIRCFADADFDRVLGVGCPGNTWLTDFRDLEGYFMVSSCMRRFVTMGLASDSISHEKIISDTYRLGRPVGLLRLLSHRDTLKLPFQTRPMKPYLETRRGDVTFDFEGYLRALMQGASISLSRLDEIKNLHSQLTSQLANVDNCQLLHGKDCIVILGHLLKAQHFDENSIEPSLWMSIDRNSLTACPNLESAIKFLKRES